MKKSYVLKNNRTGEEIPEFHTKVDVTLTETEIIFEFDCKNTKFFSYSEGYNSELWRGDVCEAYICTSGDVSRYYEIQVAPNNSNYCATVYNPDGNFRSTFVEKNPITSSVQRFGDDYKVKFSLPLNLIGYDKDKGILMNVFRIETEGGEQDKNLLALNPTLDKTYHIPKLFVRF